MKRILLFSICIFSVFVLNAQTDVTLKLNHKLGTEDFVLGEIGENNLGHEFKASRLEYYVSEITIVHDGGTETEVPLEVIALVRPEDEVSTSIPLGNFDVTTIESVKFHIGVYEPVNHGDPTLFPGDHPLAPKSPSMHWGWVAGYRFVAYHGAGGMDFSQNFEMHGLGESNYFEVSADVDVEDVAGTLVMNLTGDYEKGLNDIDLTVGTISHGETGAALQVLVNWRDDVFGNSYVGVNENAQIEWILFPNPTAGIFTVNLNSNNQASRIVITNLLGEVLINKDVIDQTNHTFEMNASGVYMVLLYGANDTVIATDRIVIE